MSIVDEAEIRGSVASATLDPVCRPELGQFMTPAPIARYMASMFSDTSGTVALLDPGAGVGVLTAALVERLCRTAVNPDSASLVCYELAPELVGHLSNILNELVQQLESDKIKASFKVNSGDFILCNSNGRQADFFQGQFGQTEGFTHVIMNPPYRKISSRSEHRVALRKAGLETSNLYTAFMFLAALQLQQGGEMVAIIPRSFCNGPYFKPFRKQFFSLMSLRHIHVFERRDAAFRGDGVLQENIIIHATKGTEPSRVKITVSKDTGPEVKTVSEREVEYSSVIRPDDPEKFVHIVTDELDQNTVQEMARFSSTLFDIGLEVSTGAVVDFRSRPFLQPFPDAESAPLLYPAHFYGNRLEWPKSMKKPNAIRVTERSRKWLWPNQGNFVITKRFSAKEEHRRIVASIYSGDLPGELIGFENHLNVFHSKKAGFGRPLAQGLSIYLNSSLVDRYFRQFNGHTQVNATDLRALPYPERIALERVGNRHAAERLSQEDVDEIVSSELMV